MTMKLFNIITTSLLGFAMAIGTGVAINNNQVEKTEAATSTLTIDASDFNTTSYAANDGEHTKGGIKWASNQVMKSGNNMQFKKSNGYIYNVTDLGTIKSVVVNTISGSFTTYYGTSSHPTSGTTVGGGFFTVKVGSATGSASSIVITYEKTESTSPLSSLTLTGCPTELNQGQHVDLGYTGKRADGTNWEGDVTYISSNETVAVEIDGTLYANQPGTTNISVKATGAGAGGADVISPVVALTVNAVEARVFTLIDSADDLKAGSNYMIASGNAETPYFMTSEQRNNNRGAAQLAVSSSQASIYNDDYEVLTLGGSEGQWTLFANNSATQGYLYAAASSSNYLRTQATNDDNGKWAITFDNGVASLVAQGSNTRNGMKFNTTDKLFACYAEGGPLYLYKEEVQDDPNKIIDSLLVTGTLEESAKTLVEGQTFVPTGLTIYAVFTDSTTYPNEDVTNLLSWSELSIGDTSVTGSYTFKEVTKTCTISGLTVVAKSPKSLSIADKVMNFTIDDNFTLGSAVITLTYDNGSKKTISHDDPNLKVYLEEEDITTSGYLFAESDVGTYSIKVTYTENNKTVQYSYTITISDNFTPLSSFYDGTITLKTARNALTADDWFDIKGVVIQVIGYCYYIQDGEYGLYVYNEINSGTEYLYTYYDGIAVGDYVKLHTRVYAYNALVETNSRDSAQTVTKLGTRQLPAPAMCANAGEFASLHQSIRASVSGLHADEDGLTRIAAFTGDSTSDQSFNAYDTNEQYVKIFISKNLDNTEKALIVNRLKTITATDTLEFVRATVAFYSGHNQISLSSYDQIVIHQASEDKVMKWAETYLFINDNNYDTTNNGFCLSKGYYVDAKRQLMALEESESGSIYRLQNENQFADAKARYEAWASACGDTSPYAGDGIISMNKMNNVVNNNVVIIMVSVTIIAISSLGLFFFLRKRRVNK